MLARVSIGGFCVATALLAHMSIPLAQSGECTYSVSPTEIVIDSAEHNGSVFVTTQDGCYWGVDVRSTFLRLFFPSVPGPYGSLAWKWIVGANPSPYSRTAIITLAGQVVTLTQLGDPTAICTYALSPSVATADHTAQSGSVYVYTQDGCPWAAATSDSWVTLDPASGSGRESFGWTITANMARAERIARITAAGQSFALTQSGVPCPYSISPGAAVVDSRAHTGTIVVTTDSDCTWTASSSRSWASVSPPSGGPGSGTVIWHTQTNGVLSDRAATLRIGDQTFALTQRRWRISGDVDGDGRADLVFQHDVAADPALDAKIGVWFMEGEVRLGGGRFEPDGEADLAWKLESMADFDRDGQPDLLFRHAAEGRLQFWRMRRDLREGAGDVGPQEPIEGPVADPSWRLAGSADFNGDDTPDLVFQNDVTGALSVSFVNGSDTTFSIGESRALTPDAVDTRWQIRGVGDLNADEYPDIVWQDTLAGGVAVWFMQRLEDGTIAAIDTRWLSQSSVGDPEWKIAAVVDLNNDHRADIVWQHQAGGWVAVWFMWENVVLDTRFLTPNRVTDTGWKIVGPK